MISNNLLLENSRGDSFSKQLAFSSPELDKEVWLNSKIAAFEKVDPALAVEGSIQGLKELVKDRLKLKQQQIGREEYWTESVQELKEALQEKMLILLQANRILMRSLNSQEAIKDNQFV